MVQAIGRAVWSISRPPISCYLHAECLRQRVSVQHGLVTTAIFTNDAITATASSSSTTAISSSSSSIPFRLVQLRAVFVSLDQAVQQLQISKPKYSIYHMNNLSRGGTFYRSQEQENWRKSAEPHFVLDVIILLPPCAVPPFACSLSLYQFTSSSPARRRTACPAPQPQRL